MTVSGARAMRDSAPLGEGERREAARRRKRWLIVAGLLGIGIASGYSAGHYDSGADAVTGPAAWPPAVAVGLAGIYLIASIGGSFLVNAVLDEVERKRGHMAMSFAGNALIVIYPAWYILWRGGLAVEPIHWVLFASFWLSLALATLWFRFRQG
jgi:hypothetical protein